MTCMQSAFSFGVHLDSVVSTVGVVETTNGKAKKTSLTCSSNVPILKSASIVKQVE